MPAPPSHEQQIHDALLVADWSTLYWAAMARRYAAIDKWISIILAVVSCSAVGSWALWKTEPVVWQTLSVITAAISTAQPFFTFGSRIEQMFHVQSKWVEFETSYQQLWNNLNHMTPQEALDQFHELLQSQSVLGAQCARLPSGDEKLKLKCKKAVLNSRGLPHN